mmetsp:Transcript_103060/g.177767  ORF Transcript_103060/g.177767 Transcript_103060/m.177767 type:complete len:113 (-) Transcript_103060:234-572(-)
MLNHSYHIQAPHSSHLVEHMLSNSKSTSFGLQCTRRLQPGYNSNPSRDYDTNSKTGYSKTCMLNYNLSRLAIGNSIHKKKNNLSYTRYTISSYRRDCSRPFRNHLCHYHIKG